MNRLAGPAVAALLLLGTTGSPSAGWAQGATPSMSVTAAPKWGRSNPGAWTPYLVRVRNDGLATVEADLVLVPERQLPPPDPLGDQRGFGPTLALRGPSALGLVPTLGRTEVGLPATPGPDLLPSDFPSHRTSVTLAGRGERTLTLLVVEAPAGYRAEVRTKHGRTIATSPPVPIARGGYTVAVLSRVPDVDVTLRNLDTSRAHATAVTRLSSPRDLPDTPLLLSGLHALVIDDADTSALTRAQLDTLRGYVALGGSLVLAGGPGGGRTALPLPEELTPLRPTGTATVPLAPLADLAGTGTTASAAIVTGEARSGRSVLDTADGRPMVVQGEYGAGRVVQLAYDPVAEPIASDEVLRDVAWEQGLSRALARFGQPGLPPFNYVPAALPPLEQLWSTTLADPSWTPWPRWSTVTLGGFGLLAAPAAFFVARIRARRGLLWLAVPALALVALAAAVAAGSARRDRAQSVVDVAFVGPDGTTLTSSYAAVVGIGPRTLTVAAGQQAGGSTIFAMPALQPIAVEDSLASPLANRGVGGGVVAQEPSRVKVTLSARPGQLRTAGFVSVSALPAIEAHLRLRGSDPPPTAGTRVAGTVTNHSTSTVRDLRAQLPEGAQARLRDVIRPGETVDIDAPLVWPGISGPMGQRASSTELVMFAAAAHSFSHPGQLALVHPEDGRADRIAVRVHPVPLERTENLVSYLWAAHVVSSVPSPPGSWVNVADLGGLPGLGPVSLTFLNPSLEVYDWTSRAWRAPQAGPPDVAGFRTTSLDDSQVRSGLVRVRERGILEGVVNATLALRDHRPQRP